MLRSRPAGPTGLAVTDKIMAKMTVTLVVLILKSMMKFFCVLQCRSDGFMRR
jgi:hypothetical protein